MRSNYKVEYEILSGLPPHKNIVHLYAFFYDRPKIHQKLQMLGEGIGLFILMEQLTQNMKGMLDTLRRGPGPAVSVSLLQCMYVKCIVVSKSNWLVKRCIMWIGVFIFSSCCAQV